jgi:hypothetical protein
VELSIGLIGVRVSSQRSGKAWLQLHKIIWGNDARGKSAGGKTALPGSLSPRIVKIPLFILMNNWFLNQKGFAPVEVGPCLTRRSSLRACIAPGVPAAGKSSALVARCETVKGPGRILFSISGTKQFPAAPAIKFITGA